MISVHVLQKVTAEYAAKKNIDAQQVLLMDYTAPMNSVTLTYRDPWGELTAISRYEIDENGNAEEMTW